MKTRKYGSISDAELLRALAAGREHSIENQDVLEEVRARGLNVEFAEPMSEPARPSGWEYRVFKFSPTGLIFRGGKIDDVGLAKELNALGEQDWEVVGVFTSTIGNGATNEVAVILKRRYNRESQVPAKVIG